MANILIHPNSGIIEFSTGTAGGGQFNPNFTGGALAARMIYDNYGGLNFTSYVSNPTGLERFSIDGADGRLFSVTDSLSGSIFSVNDIAGLPIIEAFDDNTVVMGAFDRNDFIITGNSVGIGALPNTGTQKLFVSGNFAVSGSSVFSIRPTVNGIGVVLSGEAATPQNLATTGSTLDTKINSLSGYSNNTFATITNLAATGAANLARINSLSGTLTSTYATIANLASTGSNLQTQINNLDLTYATDASVTAVANNLATTGSTLNTKINTLSGYSNSNFATITNLAATGAANLARINSLSGTLTSTYATIANLASTGSNLQTQINNLDLTYATDASVTAVANNLATTGSTLNTKINTLSGYSNSNFATITNLAATGAANLARINSLSGTLTSTYATIANLASTGSNLQTQINNLDLTYATDASVTAVANNLATTGSTLNTKINTLSGYSNSNFATITNLAATGAANLARINSLSGTLTSTYATIANLASTGSTLATNLAATGAANLARINSLSGYINSPNSNIVFTTGTQSIGGYKTFTGDSFALQIGGSGLEKLTVDGSNGRLFAVTDSFSGSLFSVNNIAGLPVIEAFDNNKVVMGAFNRNDFIITGNSVGIGALPNTGTQKLFVSGNFAVSGSSVFSIRPTVNGSGVVLSGEAATPQNLATTGSTLNTRITNLSGYINSPSSNIVFTTGDQTINGTKSFVTTDNANSVVASFDAGYGNPLEIVTTDEPLSVGGYGSSAYAIGVGAYGFAVKYTSSESDWGQPILVTEGGTTVVRPTATISFSQQVQVSGKNVYVQKDVKSFTGNNFTPNANEARVFEYVLTGIGGATATLNAPTNLFDGDNILIKIQQSPSGSNSMVFNSSYKFPGGVVPSLTLEGSRVDIYTILKIGSNFYSTYVKDFTS